MLSFYLAPVTFVNKIKIEIIKVKLQLQVIVTNRQNTDNWVRNADLLLQNT